MATESKITLRLVALEEHEFAPGETVRLKSGGPRMTVGSASGARVDVSWFDRNGALQHAAFFGHSLVPVNKGHAHDHRDQARP